MAVRSATPQLVINGQDVTSVIAPSIEEMTYKESIDSKSDSIDITLADPEGKLRLTWNVESAMTVVLTLACQNWNFPGETLTRNCGTFYIWNLKCSSDKSKGTTMSVHALSYPYTPQNSMRLERKSRGKNSTSLSNLAQQIATENGLTLHYLATENPKLGRTDSHDQSDFVLLHKHCSESDLTMKVKDNGLWIMSHEQLEKQGPVGTIVCPTPTSVGGINGGGVISWHLEQNIDDVHKACEVAYKDHKTGKVVRQMVSDPDNQKQGTTHRHKHNPHDQEDTDTDPGSQATEVDTANLPILPQFANIVPTALYNAASSKIMPVVSQIKLQTPLPTNDTNPVKNARASRVARAKLKQKNRKKHKSTIEIPFNPIVESGTVYTLQGFSPVFDGNWLVKEITDKFSGGSGTTTSMELEKCITSF